MRLARTIVTLGTVLLAAGCGMDMGPYPPGAPSGPYAPPPAAAGGYGYPTSTGGVALTWDLQTGGRSLSCGQAGVDTITINLQDTYGNLMYGPNGFTEPCADANDNTTVVTLDQIPAGSYQVLMTGTGVGGTYVESGTIWVDITAGVPSDPTQPTAVSLNQ